LTPRTILRTIFVDGVSLRLPVSEPDPGELSVRIPEHVRGLPVDGGLVECRESTALLTAESVRSSEVDHLFDQLQAGVTVSVVLEALGFNCNKTIQIKDKMSSHYMLS
jgi:hypothetical protein